jgi:hypothetical protein
LYLKDAHPLFEAFLCLTPAKGIPSDLDQPTRYDVFVAEQSLVLAGWHRTTGCNVLPVIQVFFDLASEILLKALTYFSNSFLWSSI